MFVGLPAGHFLFLSSEAALAGDSWWGKELNPYKYIDVVLVVDTESHHVHICNSKLRHYYYKAITK